MYFLKYKCVGKLSMARCYSQQLIPSLGKLFWITNLSQVLKYTRTWTVQKKETFCFLFIQQFFYLGSKRKSTTISLEKTKCDIARRQPVCYIWRGICSSWRIPQTRGAMRHISRGTAGALHALQHYRACGKTQLDNNTS